MKATILILLFLALFSQVYAKYQHDVGVNDWSQRNIGLIKEAIIDRSKIYFLGTSGLYGYMEKQTGEIEVSSGFQNSRNISWRQAEVDHNEKLLIQDPQGFFVHNFLKNAASPLSPPLTNPAQEMIDHIVIQSDQFLIATQSSIHVLLKGNSELLVKVPEGWEVRGIAKGREETIVVGFSSANKVCVISWNQATLLKSISNLDIENESNCLARTESGDKNKLIVANDFLVYDHQGLLVNTNVTAQLPVQGSKLHVCHKTGVVVVVKEFEAFFYQLQGQEFIEIYKVQEKKQNVFAFDKQGGTSKTLYFITSAQGISTIYALNTSTKSAAVLIRYKPKYDTSPLQFWLKSKETQEILVQDTDLRTYFLIAQRVLSDKEAGNGEVWTREDGLSSLDGLIILDYNQAQNKKINSYYQSLEQHGVNNPLQVISNFGKRVIQEISGTVDYVSQNYSLVQSLLKGLWKINSLKDFTQLNKLLTSDVEYEITYGLKKIIVGVNKNRTIYSIDSKTGEVLWKSTFIARYVTPDYDFHGFYQIENRSETTVTEETLLIYHSPVTTKLFIFTVSPLSGSLGYVARFLMASVKKVFKINIDVPNVQQAIAIIDQDFNIYGYPNSIVNPLAEDKHDNIFYLFDQEKKEIYGYRYLSGQQFSKIWNFQLSQDEELVEIQSASNERNHPKIAVFDDSKVILKHIDYSNIAVLTKKATAERLSGNGMLSLRIFNCKSGRVIYSAFETGVDLKQPINLLYDENGVFIWVVELFSNKMENSFVNMLQTYFFNDNDSKSNNFSYLQQDIDIIALEQKYGYSLGIKKMSVVTTKLSLTRRNLVIITPNNQIHSLDRDFLSTRRAVKTPGQDVLPSSLSFESTTLPPYAYLLPIDKTSILSYYKQLNDIKEVKFSGTNLESTIIFIAYGNDVFVSSVTPDKTFDLINEDFNYLIVIISIIVSVVGAFLAKKYALKSALNKLFETKENNSIM